MPQYALRYRQPTGSEGLVILETDSETEAVEYLASHAEVVLSEPVTVWPLLSPSVYVMRAKQVRGDE